MKPAASDIIFPSSDTVTERWCCIYRLGTALPRVSALPSPVVVWLTEPHPDQHGQADAWLSPAERVRLDRMQHPRARAEFLSGRWLVRGVLGGLLSVLPVEVPLAETADGALFCTIPGAPVFNLSHTPGLLALVVAGSGAVGVDVEWSQRSGRTIELADRYFAPSEVVDLRNLSDSPQPGGSSQRRRFFALWTLKEAWIKARGLGLRIPLHSFAFHFRADAKPVIVSRSHGTTDEVSENAKFQLTQCQGPEIYKLTQCQDISISTTPEAGDDRPGWRFLQLQPMPHHHLAVAWLPEPVRID